MSRLKVWVCTDHDTRYPVGGASIVVAEDEQRARILLSAALSTDGLDGDKFTLQEIDLSHEKAEVLLNGDY